MSRRARWKDSNDLARRVVVNAPREDVLREREQYDAKRRSARATKTWGREMSNSNKVKVPLPTGGEGTNVQVEESAERWSEFKLGDGTVVRAKVTMMSAVRLDNQYDQLGNPMYVTNLTPIMVIVSVPDTLKKKMQ
jgi:hypothetical protein